MELVSGDGVDALLKAAWPGDYDVVNLGAVAQAEMEGSRGLCEVTARPVYLTGQDFRPSVKPDHGADGVAIASLRELRAAS